MSTKEPKATLCIQDYLEASSDATKRTRIVLLTMVVASVLAAIGVLNSLQNSWMQGRIIAYQHPDSSYATALLGDYHPDANPQKQRLYEARYMQLYAAAARGYVETNSVHIPFFGVNCDINDLGIVSGFALVIILIWFRLCIRVEIENLNLSFTESRHLGQLPEFYRLLAMRQVMTTPRVPGRLVHRFYLIAPIALCIIPAAVYVVLSIHDYLTRYVGDDLNMQIHTDIVLSLEGLFSAVILWFTFQAWRRWRRLDQAWTWYWCEYLVLTLPSHRDLEDPNGQAPIAKYLEEHLNEPLGKLIGTSLEESVLSLLRKVKKDNCGTHEYASDSGSIVLSLNIDAQRKLASWEVAVPEGQAAAM